MSDIKHVRWEAIQEILDVASGFKFLWQQILRKERFPPKWNCFWEVFEGKISVNNVWMAEILHQLRQFIDIVKATSHEWKGFIEHPNWCILFWPRQGY